MHTEQRHTRYEGSLAVYQAKWSVSVETQPSKVTVFSWKRKDCVGVQAKTTEGVKRENHQTGFCLFLGSVDLHSTAQSEIRRTGRAKGLLSSQAGLGAKRLQKEGFRSAENSGNGAPVSHS